MATAKIMPPLAAVHPALMQTCSVGHHEPVLDGDGFDPARHIDFVPPPKVHTMQELNFPENVGVSSVAVSEPFQLFTPEAIHQMRAEILSSKVWDNCQYSSNLAQCQLRGFASK